MVTKWVCYEMTDTQSVDYNLQRGSSDPNPQLAHMSIKLTIHNVSQFGVKINNLNGYAINVLKSF